MFKCSFIYTQILDRSRTGGWTTSFYNNAGSIDSAITFSRSLARLLNLAAGDQSVVRGVRITDLANPRNARTIDIAVTGATGNASDYSTNAIHCTLYGSTLQPVGFWLRGIPDDCIKSGKLIGNLLAAFPNFVNLQNELTNAGNLWSIRRVPGAQLKFDIQAWNGLTTQTPTFVTAQAMGLALTDQVRVMYVKGFPYLKRVWKVTSVSADGLTIGIGPNYNPPAAAPTITNKGKARRVTATGPTSVVQNEQITKLTFDYATKHNVGKPPLELSGRRRTPR